MTDELKQLIEDAAKLLGYKLAYLTHSDTPYLADKNGEPTYYIFNPLDPDRGDLWKVAETAGLGIDFESAAIIPSMEVDNYLYKREIFTKGDYQSQALAVLRAASAVLKARGEE